MINQEYKAQVTKYQVLPNVAICCRELRVPKVTSFHVCVSRFCCLLFIALFFAFKPSVTNGGAFSRRDKISKASALLENMSRVAPYLSSLA